MNVAIFGGGLIGRPIAERLKTTGYSVTIYNRTLSKIAQLPQAGIAVTDRPEEALRAATCVILALTNAQAIREVLLSSLTRQDLAGHTVIQMGTIGPHESQALEGEIVASGGEYLEAPVLGSIAEVRAGKLIVMVGGTAEQFQRWMDLLGCLGAGPRLIGRVGAAATLKLALNQLIATEMAAFALSLGLIERQGVPVETFMAVLRESSLFAPMYEKKLPRLIKRDYTNPNFSALHMLKDTNLFLQEAKRVCLETDSLEGIPGLLRRTIEQDLGEMDYSALYEVVNPQQM